MAFVSRHDFPRANRSCRTPQRGYRAARVCYDHLAGALGVRLHDRFKELGWLTSDSNGRHDAYDLSEDGKQGFVTLGVDVEETNQLRRRFAYACLDWSERRPHIGGGLGAALLKVAIRERWVAQDLDSRAIRVTSLGRKEMMARFGIEV